MPVLQEFDIEQGGPDEFLLGLRADRFVFTRMGSRTDPAVWKCAKAAEGYVGKRLYFFSINCTGEALYLLAHGDEAMETPQQVQAAYLGGRMPVFCGSVDNQHGEGALEYGDHAWDFFINNERWSGLDFLLMTWY